MLRLIIFLRPFARNILIIWLLTILAVSSIPHIPTLKIHVAKSEIRLDYLFHFGEYGVLAFMAFLSFATEKFKLSLRKFIIITATLILFAILDELHQKFIPGRTCSSRDVLSDVTGIIAAVLFCIAVFRKIVKSPLIN
jgi:VanZ family protein